MRIAALLLLAACGSTIRTTEINPAPHPLGARPPETVEVFTSGPPARPHVDVSFLEIQQESKLSIDDTRELIAKLRIEAAARGCEGLVIGGVTHEPTGGDQTTSLKGMTATCIVYTDADPQLAAGSRTE